jgi:hypothetical protein
MGREPNMAHVLISADGDCLGAVSRELERAVGSLIRVGPARGTEEI